MNAEYESDIAPLKESDESLITSFIKLYGEKLPPAAKKSFFEFLKDGSHLWLASGVQYIVTYEFPSLTRTLGVTEDYDMLMRILIPKKQPKERVFVWGKSVNQWRDDSDKTPFTHPDI